MLAPHNRSKEDLCGVRPLHHEPKFLNYNTGLSYKSIIIIIESAVESFTNKEIAELLRSIAAAYTVKDENKYKFQIIAYQRAADSIEHASSEVKDLWDEGKISEIAGVGPSIASHLDELFKKGKVKHFEEVFKGLPPAMFEMLKIPGVGPKTAFKLTKFLKIFKREEALTRLEEALKAGGIRQLEGFGEVSEAKILKGIQEFSRKSERILLPIAAQIATDILDYLEKNPAVLKADPLGSLRRQCSTVGDIDIAVASNNPERVIEYFKGYPKKIRVLEAGKATASLLHRSGYQVDLMIQPPSAYGALLQHFTGSKHHNIKLREIALKKRYSLSEYGIRPVKKGEKLEIGSEKEERPKGRLKEFATEEEFYNFLGMEWIPPELREDSGEIEAALQKRLPRLVETADIKGDLHIHSDFPIETSHDEGVSSIGEIVTKAASLGYEYVALTEHNPSTSMHSEMQIIDLLKRKKEHVEQFNYPRVKKVPVRILNSLEIDIKPNGSLAIPEKGLDFLDFAIVSIHTSFRMDKDSMTRRILKALSHPKVRILGHPTGRKLNQREGYEFDWEKIFEFCLKQGKWLEINAWPDRLDLPDTLVREAVKKGVKMVINTDSHAANQLALMEYGVSVARRGWAEKKDIINTLGYDKIIEELKGGEK